MLNLPDCKVSFNTKIHEPSVMGEMATIRDTVTTNLNNFEKVKKLSGSQKAQR